MYACFVNFSPLRFDLRGVSGYGVDEGVDGPPVDAGVEEALADASSPQLRPSGFRRS